MSYNNLFYNEFGALCFLSPIKTAKFLRKMRGEYVDSYSFKGNVAYCFTFNVDKEEPLFIDNEQLTHLNKSNIVEKIKSLNNEVSLCIYTLDEPRYQRILGTKRVLDYLAGL